MLYRIFLLVLSIVLLPISLLAKEPSPAQQAFWTGHYEQAITHWQQQLQNSSQASQHLHYRLRIATAQRQMGAYSWAEHQLQQVQSELQKPHVSAELKADFYTEYSKLMTAKGRQYWPKAQGAIQQAIKWAQTAHQPQQQARVLNQRGNLQGLLLEYEMALGSYAKALALLSPKDHELRDKILINQAHKTYLLETDNAYQHDHLNLAYQNSIERVLQILTRSEDWQDVYAQIMGQINIVQLALQINQQLSPPDERLQQQAYHALQQAIQRAKNIQQARALSHAQGALGGMYLQQSQLNSALQLTQQALFNAQSSADNKLFYLWYQQLGEIYKQQNKLPQAIKAYQNAVDKLTPIRLRDAQTGYCDIQDSFRERIAPAYFELADLLLQQAAHTDDPAHKKALLLKARDSIESFKGAELQAYYQDDCIAVYAEEALVDQYLDQHTAVLYPIALRDRLELLLSLNGHIYQKTLPIAQEHLAQTVALFLSPLRQHPYPQLLERGRGVSRGVNRGVSRSDSDTANSIVCSPEPRGEAVPLPNPAKRFKQPAQDLYQWLIKPLNSVLQQHQIHTLVVAPDGVLRTMPFAALYNGQQFLIEEYALAVIPSLSLSHVEQHQSVEHSILLAALSDARHGFSAIPCAEYEINALNDLLSPTHPPLVNKGFLKSQLQQRLSNSNDAFVHIATHGQFNADLDKTFILTYDEALSLNTLEQLMKLSTLRQRPIELLTLSACETAAGDDRAALGLAGVALKAGVNSALASLWQVDDEATPAVILEFYRQLMDQPEHSKAQALQQAQIKLLRSQHLAQYHHPYYWAAFLLIGNWL